MVTLIPTHEDARSEGLEANSEAVAAGSVATLEGQEVRLEQSNAADSEALTSSSLVPGLPTASISVPASLHHNNVTSSTGIEVSSVLATSYLPPWHRPSTDSSSSSSASVSPSARQLAARFHVGQRSVQSLLAEHFGEVSYPISDASHLTIFYIYL